MKARIISLTQKKASKKYPKMDTGAFKYQTYKKKVFGVFSSSTDLRSVSFLSWVAGGLLAYRQPINKTYEGVNIWVSMQEVKDKDYLARFCRQD